MFFLNKDYSNLDFDIMFILAKMTKDTNIDTQRTNQ